MENGTAMGLPLDGIAHIIQVALTPVFLLSGIAALLNAVNTRLGRISDQAETARAGLRGARGREAAGLRARHRRLLRRLRALDAARGCGALAGAAICAATFALFVGALQDAAVATALVLSFGASVLFTLAALVGMFAEVLLSWRRDPLPTEDADGD